MAGQVVVSVEDLPANVAIEKFSRLIGCSFFPITGCFIVVHVHIVVVIVVGC